MYIYIYIITNPKKKGGKKCRCQKILGFPWIPSTKMFFTASSAGATVLATTDSWGKIC
jgi:hypothetical protein